MTNILERYGTVLRIYDNGGRTFDRYTIIPPRWAKEYREHGKQGLFQAIGSSRDPFYPQGFGMHVTAAPGKHLGKRIHWRDLPPAVQQFARQSFPEYAPMAASLIDLSEHCEPSTGRERDACYKVAEELGEENHVYDIVRRAGDDTGYYVLAEIFVRDPG